MTLVSKPIEQFKSHKKNILDSIKKTLDSGQYILGKNVLKFELLNQLAKERQKQNKKNE